MLSIQFKTRLAASLAWTSLVTWPSLAAHGETAVATPQTVTPEVIQHYSDLARSQNPSVKARSAEATASRHAVGMIKTWEDPTLKLSGSTSAGRGPNLREDGDLAYGVEQRLPLFGKARARVAAAEQDQRTAELAIEYQTQILRREIAKSLYRIALASGRIRLTQEDVSQLELWLQTAERRHEAGGASQVEVLRLHTELSKAREQLITRQSQLRHEQATLNRLINQDIETPLPAYQLPDISDQLPFTKALADLAVRFEPKLQLLGQQAVAAESRIEIARRDRLPDISLGIDGRQDSRDGGLREGTFTLGLSVPWLNRGRYRQDLLRARTQAEAARLDVEDYQLGVREEVHLLTLNADTARREALLYQNEIIPRAQRVIDVALSAWSSGQGQFNDLVEGRRMLIEGKVMRLQAITEQYLMLSELLLCCGLSDLEALDQYRESTPHHSPTKTQP